MVASKIKADHSFFWNKLFSFSGIFPAGAFLAEHFWANSYALVSIDKYDETSRGLQQIPWPVPIEFLFIWLPILFHGGYGVYVWWRGKSNLVQYPWMGNWMYSVQRWTGIIAFANPTSLRSNTTCRTRTSWLSTRLALWRHPFTWATASGILRANGDFLRQRIRRVRLLGWVRL